MLIAGFPAGPWGTNCYVVATAPGTECVVIDPGMEATEGVAEVVRQHRLKPVSVLVTHGHVDHMWCVAPVAGAYDATAWIHPADRHLLADPMAGMSPGDRADAAGRRLLLGRAGRRPGARRPPGPGAGGAAVRRRPHARPHRGVGDLPVAAHRRLGGHVLRRPAVRGLDRPHGPARAETTRPCSAAWPPRCSRSPTTWSSCPVTASRPRSAGSGRPTRSSRTCRSR